MRRRPIVWRHKPRASVTTFSVKTGPPGPYSAPGPRYLVTQPPATLEMSTNGHETAARELAPSWRWEPLNCRSSINAAEQSVIANSSRVPGRKFGLEGIEYELGASHQVARRHVTHSAKQRCRPVTPTSSDGRRVPAAELERLVADRVCTFPSNDGGHQQILDHVAAGPEGEGCGASSSPR